MSYDHASIDGSSLVYSGDILGTFSVGEFLPEVGCDTSKVSVWIHCQLGQRNRRVWRRIQTCWKNQPEIS